MFGSKFILTNVISWVLIAVLIFLIAFVLFFDSLQGAVRSFACSLLSSESCEALGSIIRIDEELNMECAFQDAVTDLNLLEVTTPSVFANDEYLKNKLQWIDQSKNIVPFYVSQYKVTKNEFRIFFENLSKDEKNGLMMTEAWAVKSGISDDLNGKYIGSDSIGYLTYEMAEAYVDWIGGRYNCAFNIPNSQQWLAYLKYTLNANDTDINSLLSGKSEWSTDYCETGERLLLGYPNEFSPNEVWKKYCFKDTGAGPWSWIGMRVYMEQFQ